MVRDMLKESGCGRKAPHAGSTRINCSKGSVKWSKSGSSLVRELCISGGLVWQKMKYKRCAAALSRFKAYEGIPLDMHSSSHRTKNLLWEAASMFCKDGKEKQCVNHGKWGWQTPKSPGLMANDEEVKKPGQKISKGHKNFDLMINLQMGISYAVGKHASMVRELRPGDFDPMEKFWTGFPSEGSKCRPPHQSMDFKWKNYCPMVFRELFGIDAANYMLAICGNDALRELSSPGKSGSVFYITQDDRFMIKTIKKSEVKVLIRMLPKVLLMSAPLISLRGK